MIKLLRKNIQSIVTIGFGLILNLIFYKIGVNVELIAILTSGFVLVGLFSKQIYKFSFGSTGVEIQLQELQEKYDALSYLALLFVGRWHSDDMEKVKDFVFNEYLPNSSQSSNSQVARVISEYRNNLSHLETQLEQENVSREEFPNKISELTNKMISDVRNIILL